MNSMSTPRQGRVPFADLTSSSNTASPRRPIGSKRSAPSPFSRPSSHAIISSTANKKRALPDIAKEQRIALNENWASTYRMPNESHLQKIHSLHLQAVIDFANLERRFGA